MCIRDSSWTLETLFGEVMKEHHLFAKAEQVAAILRRADQLDLKSGPSEQAERLNIALRKMCIRDRMKKAIVREPCQLKI